MENITTTMMVIGFLLLVIMLPAIVGAIARLIWKNSHRVLLAASIAILLFAFDYIIRPDQVEQLMEPMIKNEFASLFMFTMITFILLIRIVFIGYIAILGIRFVDKTKRFTP